jgi:hypothetical protein
VISELGQHGKEPYVGVTAIGKEGNFGTAAINAETMPWATISDTVLSWGKTPNAEDGREPV